MLGFPYAPALSGDPPQNVLAQPKTFDHPGVIEVVGGVVAHTDTPHDRLRSQIGGRGEGDDLVDSARRPKLSRARLNAHVRGRGGGLRSPLKVR
jgi:hypothetical protein